MNLRLRWMLAALLALGLVLTACGDSGGEGGEEPTAAAGGGTEGGETEAVAVETIKEGVLTVCTDSPYPPMEFEEDGEFTGFDIELMRAIAGEMGLEVEVVNSGFDPITSGTALESGQCDIAAASITITPEREEAIAFSEPYFDAEQSLLVKTDAGIASLADLEGKSIGVQSGTTGEGYAKDNDPGASEIRSFDAPGDLFSALEAGQIDAILQDLPVNGYRSTQDDSVEVVETYPTDEQYGFGMSKDATELKSAVDGALQSLRDSGAYDELYTEWFGGA